MNARLVFSAMVFAASSAGAQCPDGAPPPCRSSAISAPLRVNPPLNAREWIVVPFTNVTRAADLDWLRDASVNLLSLDLSRWTDIGVVDDKRVTDLLRELPGARTSRALSLGDGLALARRAGAGRLVMGDYIKLGRATRLVANVFDVTTGAHLRSVSAQAADADSLLTAFGPLARAVLDVPPPPDAKIGSLGTSRLDAYQEYLLGAAALNRVEMLSAQAHLKRALALDSSFALAHWKLAVAYTWGSLGQVDADSLYRFHAAAAVQHGSNLPERPRLLMAAEVAASVKDDLGACRILAPLVARDSSDVEALMAFGACNYQNSIVVPSATDSTVGRFATSWNTAFRAFRRVLQLDPRFHVVYEYFVGPTLTAGRRYGCVTRPTVGFCNAWVAELLPSGDSLIEIPVLEARNPAARATQVELAKRAHAHTVLYRAAQQTMQAWVDAAPQEPRAHYELGRVLERLGESAAADAQFRQVDASTDANTWRMLPQWRMEFAIKLGHGTEARAWFDSLVARTPDRPGTAWRRGSWDAIFGRFARFRAWVDQNPGFTPEQRGYVKRLPALMLGARDDAMPALEAAWLAAPRAMNCNRGCGDERIIPSLAYGLTLPRTAWPALSDSSADQRLLPAMALAAHDTAALRRAALKLEAYMHGLVDAGDADLAGTGIVAVDAFTLLRDSTHALEVARFMVDSAIPKGILFATLGNDWPGSPVLWPRAMLQRADLAAALGFRDEAHIWYARLLDLWADADAEMQPTIVRIRSALGSLGATPPSRR